MKKTKLKTAVLLSALFSIICMGDCANTYSRLNLIPALEVKTDFKEFAPGSQYGQEKLFLFDSKPANMLSGKDIPDVQEEKIAFPADKNSNYTRMATTPVNAEPSGRTADIFK